MIRTLATFKRPCSVSQLCAPLVAACPAGEEDGHQGEGRRQAQGGQGAAFTWFEIEARAAQRLHRESPWHGEWRRRRLHPTAVRARPSFAPHRPHQHRSCLPPFFQPQKAAPKAAKAAPKKKATPKKAAKKATKKA